MRRMVEIGKLRMKRLSCLPSAIIAVGAIAVGSALFARGGLTSFFGGLSFANVLVFLLLTGVLSVAVYRRNQLLKLQADLVRKQEQEIEQIHTALNRLALVSVTDRDGVITSVNEKFAECFGYSSSQLVGKPISMIYPGGASNVSHKAIRKSVSDGKIWFGETEEVAADGSRIFTRCSIVPVLNDAGEHIRTVGIRTDNTEFHRAEQARFLKSLFDHLQDEVYIYRLEGLKMVYANEAALEACGWKANDLFHKTVLDSDPDMNERLFRSLVAPLVSGEKDVVKTDVQRGETSGEISTRIVVGKDGQKLFMSVLRDSTERMAIERAKMESVSVVSHELRTPLTSIKGSLRLLDSGALGVFDAKAQSVLDIAVRNTDRLLLVVDDILDLEKIRAGKMKFTKAPVDLVGFVGEAVEMNRGYGDQLNVNFVFETDLKTACAEIAPERIMQVLANLMSNAAKYSPTYGSVSIGLHDDGRFWRIFVSDDGPGIPEEKHAEVFESFSQLRSADGVARKGTGLGMTISKKIVQAHDGEIGFESELGKGSTFFIRLPKGSADIAKIDDKAMPEAERLAIVA